MGAEGFLDFGPGRRVHYVDEGKGFPIVFFPANGGNVYDMHLVIPRLAREYRFVGIDPPGREPTDWPDEPFSFFDDLPGVYDEALHRLNVGAHVAMGHSMGGMHCFYHGRRHRDRVRALVLFEGFTTLVKWVGGTAFTTVPPITPAVAPAGFQSYRMSPDEAAAFVRRIAANRKWEEDRPRFKASFWPSQQTHDARPFVAGLNLPIIEFLGGGGRKLPETGGDWRRWLGMDGVRDLTVEVIPDAGHWMMLDDPEAVADALLRFLRRVCKTEELAKEVRQG